MRSSLLLVARDEAVFLAVDAALPDDTRDELLRWRARTWTRPTAPAVSTR